MFLFVSPTPLAFNLTISATLASEYPTNTPSPYGSIGRQGRNQGTQKTLGAEKQRQGVQLETAVIVAILQR
jgi:hypothetical protein